MRVVRDANGNFAVDDAPMKLDGHAAESFLAEMTDRDSRRTDPDRERFLAECREIYEHTKGSSG